MTTATNTSVGHTGTEDHPRYFRVEQRNSGATKHWMIVCDEGWRQSIVCADMYDWAADWLIDAIGDRPFGPRP